MYDFLSDNNLLSPNQSGFRSDDSWINQLLSINHEILNTFDKRLEVRGIFLDILKAFDKVWHDCLIFKLCQNGINADIINILRDFLRNMKQRVVLNGHCSSWADVSTVVPQESILGSLLLLMYINDLSDWWSYLLMTLLCFSWFMMLILQRVILNVVYTSPPSPWVMVVVVGGGGKSLAIF